MAQQLEGLDLLLEGGQEAGQELLGEEPRPPVAAPMARASRVRCAAGPQRAALAAAGALSLAAVGAGAILYRCRPSLRGAAGESVALASEAPVVLTAYWDDPESACGPFGQNHQADLCGGIMGVAKCPERIGVSPTVCPSGHATLLAQHGHGGDRWRPQYESGNCFYAWFAQYVCASESVARGNLLQPTCSNRARSCQSLADEASCLTAMDARPDFAGQACVWCGGGSCTSDGTFKCEARDLLLGGEGLLYDQFVAKDKYTVSVCSDVDVDSLDFGLAQASLAVPSPVGDAGALRLFTFDSRTQPLWLPMKGNRQRWYQNLGPGQPWSGFHTKMHAYHLALMTQMVNNPEQLVIITDSDMWDTGCTDQEVIERYRKIVAASGGADVVFGADPDLWPNFEGGVDAFYSTFGDRRRAVLEAFGVEEGALREFTLAKDYFFLNSGFVMGPAARLLELISCALWEGWDEAYDDQRGYAKCALKTPWKVTFDYTSSLVFTTMWMRNVLEVVGGRVRNVVTDTSQCFIHGDMLKLNPLREWLYKLPDQD